MVGNGCTLCPRRCGAEAGHSFCGKSNQVEAAAVCLHRGEEPPLVEHCGQQRGVVNIFFAHCNLQCIYCQNQAISGRSVAAENVHYRGVEQIADAVCRLLPHSSGIVGLVTAAHYANHIASLQQAIAQRGFAPTYLYNSSGYESADTLRTLEGLIDIYLPDYKYSLSALSAQYSHAPDYPQRAAEALDEMRRQVGQSLKTDLDTGTAYRGMIVRHLVLPGAVDNTLQCLDNLAQMFNPYTLHLSLMAQYYPPHTNLPQPLRRGITAQEYSTAAERYNQLGFAGWLQQPDAESNYRPNFSLTNNPFGDED